MLAKYLLLVSIFSGGLVHQCLTREVPISNTEHPVPTVVPNKHVDQDTGLQDRPEVLPDDQIHFLPELHQNKPQHTGFFHNVPPAPEPSASSYIATVSYGEGYPVVIYHCSLTDHKPSTPYTYGPNRHVCTVSFLQDPKRYQRNEIIDSIIGTLMPWIKGPDSRALPVPPIPLLGTHIPVLFVNPGK